MFTLALMNLKSNFKAINKAEKIARKRKVLLLNILLDELDIFYSEESDYQNKMEKEDVRLLRNEIQRCLELTEFFSEKMDKTSFWSEKEESTRL